MKHILILLIFSLILTGCVSVNTGGDIPQNDDTAPPPETSDRVDNSPTPEYVRSFGEYDYYYYYSEEWNEQAIIKRGDEIIFEDIGTFDEICGLPVLSEEYHNGRHSVFDKDFSLIAESIVGFREIDGSIIAYRELDGLCELIRVEGDGTLTSISSLGFFERVYDIIPEGGFALAASKVQNDALNSVPIYTLYAVDTNGDILAELGTIDRSASFIEIAGDTENGEWIFCFYTYDGDDVTYYNYYWYTKTGETKIETSKEIIRRIPQ